jgi:8-oxo-dGTP diphosphatase
MEFTEYVVGFSFSQDRSSVVLINKTKPKWQAGLFNGVGRKIEQQEVPLDAMVREFSEETGVISHPADWQHVATIYFPVGKIYFFCSFNQLNFLNAHTTTDERVVKLFVNGLRKYPIVPNLHYLIPLCLFAESDLSGSKLDLPVDFIEKSA